MTALANSLKRIWSATGRVPHQTGWGTCAWLGGTTLAGLLYENCLALKAAAQQSAPTVMVIVLNIFR